MQGNSQAQATRAKAEPTNKAVVFIFPSAYGHLVKTVLLARFYSENGYAVHYYISGKNPAIETLLPGTIHRMATKPFGTLYEAYDESAPSVRLPWWKELLARHSGRHYRERKAEVERLISDLDPALIFLDEFCATDFIILYPHLTHRRCIFLSPFLPLSPNEKIPPFHLFAPPGEQAKGMWTAYLRKRWFKRLKNTIKFSGADHTGIVNRRFKQQRIPATHRPTFTLEKLSFFANMEKWFAFPHEIDFEGHVLPADSKYMGLMLDMNRTETVSAHYQLFLNLAGRNPANKLIFCSLGTVTSELVSDSSVLMDFYTNLLQVAQACPELYIIIKTDQRVADSLKARTINCMFMAFAPQLDLLKRADVFITHAGGNSCMEAIWTATPMLTIPPVDRYDYNGHAARVVYHHFGLKTDLAVQPPELQEALYELIQNELYKNSLERMSQLFQTKYHVDYLHDLTMPLP